MKKVMRPTEFKGKSNIISAIILLWAIVFVFGIYVDNFTTSILSCLFATQAFVILGTVNLVTKYSVKICINDNVITVVDGLTSKKDMNIESKQMINISDIRYIYITNLEYMDNVNFVEYCEGAVVDKNVFFTISKEIEKLNQKIFNERYISLNKITKAIISLYYISETYAIPKNEIEMIQSNIFNNLDFEYKPILKKYNVHKEFIKSIDEAIKEYSIKVPTSVTLNTKINISSYMALKSTDIKIKKLNNGVVASNEEGTQKIYLNYYFNLNSENREILIKHINSNNPEVIYSMSDENMKNLIK